MSIVRALLILFAPLGFALGGDLVPHGAKQGGDGLQEPSRVGVHFRSRCHWVRSTDRAAQARPVMVVLPGGPGLSSHTVSTLSRLSSHSDVCLLNPPGTEGTTPLEINDYPSLVTDIEQALQSIDRNLILVGHSFGGILAADLGVRAKLSAKVKGMAFLASPLSTDSMNGVLKVTSEYDCNPAKEANDPAKEAGSRSCNSEKKKGHDFKEWFSKAGELYFAPRNTERGVQMLLSDSSYPGLMPALSGALERLKTLMNDLKKSTARKISIGGDLDRLVPRSTLLEDGAKANIPTVTLPATGHFVAFEEPDRVVDLIESRLLEK